METIILLILVTILIFVIKNNSDISLIKAQNELNHLNLERLRKRLENFEIKGEAEIQNVIDTNTETEKCPDINIGTQYSEKTVDNVPPITDNEEEKGLPTVPPFTPMAVNGDQPDSPDTDQCTPNEVSPDEEHAGNPRKANWERLIGINIFSKIGILILITGVGFFVKYAIDKEWINEMTRTILGICAGFTLWGIAYRIRDDYRNFSSILAGGGFAICFLCIGIAFHLYSLFSATATFISLVALTLSMILISLKFDRAELAFISIIGGFVTPFISSDGNGSFLFVLGYMALLNTAMSAITIHKKWHSLPILSCWLTYIICIAGYISNEFREIYGWGLVAIIYYFILFTISLTVTLNRSQLRLRTVFLNLSAIILNSLAYLSLTTLLAEKTALLSHFDGCAGIIGAAINFGIYLRYYLNKEDGPASNLLIILIAGFSLATILIQFSNPNIYIAGIGLEAAIASWLYSYSGKRIFKIIALIIGLPLSCCLIHSVVFGYDSYDESWGYIVTAIAFTWSAYYNFIRQNREGKCCESSRSSGALWAGATI